jgi:hypothetical protein
LLFEIKSDSKKLEKLKISIKKLPPINRTMSGLQDRVISPSRTIGAGYVEPTYRRGRLHLGRFAIYLLTVFKFLEGMERANIKDLIQETPPVGHVPAEPPERQPHSNSGIVQPVV